VPFGFANADMAGSPHIDTFDGIHHDNMFVGWYSLISNPIIKVQGLGSLGCERSANAACLRTVALQITPPGTNEILFASFNTWEGENAPVIVRDNRGGHATWRKTGTKSKTFLNKFKISIEGGVFSLAPVGDFHADPALAIYIEAGPYYVSVELPKTCHFQGSQTNGLLGFVPSKRRKASGLKSQRTQTGGRPRDMKEWMMSWVVNAANLPIAPPPNSRRLPKGLALLEDSSSFSGQPEAPQAQAQADEAPGAKSAAQDACIGGECLSFIERDACIGGECLEESSEPRRALVEKGGTYFKAFQRAAAKAVNSVKVSASLTVGKVKIGGQVGWSKTKGFTGGASASFKTKKTSVKVAVFKGAKGLRAAGKACVGSLCLKGALSAGKKKVNRYGGAFVVKGPKAGNRASKKIMKLSKKRKQLKKKLKTATGSKKRQVKKQLKKNGRKIKSKVKAIKKRKFSPLPRKTAGIVRILKRGLKKGGKAVRKVGKAIKNSLKRVKGAAKRLAKKAARGLRNSLKSMAKKTGRLLKKYGKKLVGKLARFFGGVTRLGKRAGKVLKAATRKVRKTFRNGFKKAGRRIKRGLKKAAKKGAKAVKKFVRKTKNIVKKTFKKLVPRAVRRGARAALRVLKRVASKGKKLGRKAVRLAKKVVRGVKRVLRGAKKLGSAVRRLGKKVFGARLRKVNRARRAVRKNRLRNNRRNGVVTRSAGKKSRKAQKKKKKTAKQRRAEFKRFVKALLRLVKRFKGKSCSASFLGKNRVLYNRCRLAKVASKAVKAAKKRVKADKARRARAAKKKAAAARRRKLLQKLRKLAKSVALIAGATLRAASGLAGKIALLRKRMSFLYKKKLGGHLTTVNYKLLKKWVKRSAKMARRAKSLIKGLQAAVKNSMLDMVQKAMRAGKKLRAQVDKFEGAIKNKFKGWERQIKNKLKHMPKYLRIKVTKKASSIKGPNAQELDEIALKKLAKVTPLVFHLPEPTDQVITKGFATIVKATKNLGKSYRSLKQCHGKTCLLNGDN